MSTIEIASCKLQIANIIWLTENGASTNMRVTWYMTHNK